MTTILSVKALSKNFTRPGSKTVVSALNGVTFDIAESSTLGVVGESGSGKTTLGRCILRLVEPTSGSVHFEGQDLLKLNRREMRSLRTHMQPVFQDPYESLNPRMRVEALVEEPLLLHTKMTSAARRERVTSLLEMVRLDTRHRTRFPHEMSGGQLQRVGIARALATSPRFLVLDEPTSSLDLSVRAGILRLLRTLQDEMRLSYLLISHDLRTVAAYCDFVAVMYLGTIVEFGPAASVFDSPQHPYTQALLSATLSADPSVGTGRYKLSGEPPNPVDLPDECVFANRCPLVTNGCRNGRPSDRLIGNDHAAACIRIDDGSNLISATVARVDDSR